MSTWKICLAFVVLLHTHTLEQKCYNTQIDETNRLSYTFFVNGWKIVKLKFSFWFVWMVFDIHKGPSRQTHTFSSMDILRNTNDEGALVYEWAKPKATARKLSKFLNKCLCMCLCGWQWGRMFHCIGG